MPVSNSETESASFSYLSVRAFLTVLAAKTPAPGGGATAALSGALAAAQARMVVEYSLGKKSLLEHQAKLMIYRTRLEKIQEMFLQLIDEDAAAYAQLSPWLSQPGDQRNGNADFQAAVIAAIRTPQTVTALANELLECCFALVGISNQNLVSDLWIAADMAAACGQSALRNVEINLPLLDVISTKEQEHAQTAELQAHNRQLTQKIPAVKISTPHQ